MKAWRNRSLGGIIYLYLDERYEGIRPARSIRDTAILIASEVKRDGKKSILAISVSLSETEVDWRAFLDEFVKSGKYGVRLVVSDDNIIMEAARKAMFTGVFW